MDILFSTLDQNYVQFENYTITLIIDKKNELWFNAKQVAISLGYLDVKDAIKRHIDKQDTIQLQYIHTLVKIKGHPQSIYINEAGLYSLILSSKLQKAKKFKKWITNDVLPSIRKYGYYQLTKKYSNEVNKLSEQLDIIVQENIRMKNELKKNKFPKGGIVYVIDYSNDDSEIYRIGMTGDMNKRKKLYDTHTLYKHNIKYIMKTSCSIRLESCIRSMLYEYRFKNNKDYYICEFKKIKIAFKTCLDSINCMDQNGGFCYIDEKIIFLKKNIKRLNGRKIYYKKKLLQ